MIAILKSIKRGFGEDSAEYRTDDGCDLVVAVSWGLLTNMETAVYKSGEKIFSFTSDDRTSYITPGDALSRAGYEVHGDVDFSMAILPRLP